MGQPIPSVTAKSGLHDRSSTPRNHPTAMNPQADITSSSGSIADDGHQAADYRTELHLAENIVNPQTWAGGMEDKRAIAPRLRIGRDKWFNLLWLLPIGFALLVAAV